MPTIVLANAVTATGAGFAFGPLGDSITPKSSRTFMASGETTAGAGAATVLIQVSNDKSNTANWMTAGTISLTLGTTTTADGLVIDAPWEFVRANVSAISGTGADVTVTMGY